MGDEARPSTAAFDNVLVATDFSPGGDRAVIRATWLPLSRGARLVVAHVAPGGMSGALAQLVEQGTRRELERTMALARTELQRHADREIQLQARVLEGEAHVVLVRAAREERSELLLLGRHGQTRLRSALLGTTAERVLRRSDCPVLAVSLAPKGPYRRPLVALALEQDEPSLERALVAQALRATGDHPERLVLTHAFTVPFEGFVTPLASARAHSAYRHGFRKAAHQRLNAFVASLGDAGVPLRAVVRCGDARSALRRELSRQRADLVVMGTHARTGPAHALLGSVAEWVIRTAACDVLVIRPGQLHPEPP